jgi:hypothetical protein
MATELLNDRYLRRYYAGQAMTGLLAAGRVNPLVTPSGETGFDEKTAKRLVKAAFAIASAMVDEASNVLPIRADAF